MNMDTELLTVIYTRLTVFILKMHSRHDCSECERCEALKATNKIIKSRVWELLNFIKQFANVFVGW